MPRAFLAVLLLVFAGTAGAQSPPEAPARGEPPPIQDNSFLMEEAYNSNKAFSAGFRCATGAERFKNKGRARPWLSPSPEAPADEPFKR